MKELNKINLSKFAKINGDHPLKKVSFKSYVPYGARVRKGAKIRYFNFDLAKEMGLIDKSFDHKLTKELEKVILDTFSFVIINEYDIENDIQFHKNEVLDREYMATRYLQLQHDDKKGLNSGDGRSVWLGQIKSQNKKWDLSACGTGATKLSPATTKYKKFFQSGDPSISYGCGYAEVDEGIAQALFSEVFYQNKINTERALLVLEFEKNYAINIRAHKNLLRPSHFFLHLKQSNFEDLKSLTDYYIEIESFNQVMKDVPSSDKKYDIFLKHITETFALMASNFESEYIFCWLDWDGDNILMDGSIIDYGSIRQFGLFHSEYRYDDIDRFSTTILEQREKARYIVQSFIQCVDFIKNKEKKNIKDFKDDKTLKEFDKIFEENLYRNLLRKVGIDNKAALTLLKEKRKLVISFYKAYSHFERAKSHKGKIKVSDGISWDAIFCMRDILRELPKLIVAKKTKISDESFIEIIKSNYATKKDLVVSPYRSKMIREFQNTYWDIITESALINGTNFDKYILSVSMRAAKMNKFSKVTGDSISVIVESILKRKKDLSISDIYEIIKNFAVIQSPYNDEKIDLAHIKNKDLILSFLDIVKEYREGL